MLEVLEWSAFGLGTIGTALWALGIKWHGRPMEGWFWLVSALLWIAFAMLNGHHGLVARDLIGTALYAVGIWKAFFCKTSAASSSSVQYEQQCELCGGTGVHQLSGPGTTNCRCKVLNTCA